MQIKGRTLGSSLVIAITCALSLFPLSVRAEKQCPEDSLRCWYVIGGMGEKPKRVTFLVRKDVSAANDIRTVEFVQAIEDVDFHEAYAVLGLRIDCDKRRFLVVNQYSGTRDGAGVRQQPYQSGWLEMSQGKYGEPFVYPFACGRPEAPGAYDVQGVYFDDAYRAPDVVDLLGKLFRGDLTGGN